MQRDELRSIMLAAAQQYVAVGLCALPAIRAEKRPAVARWKPYQTRLPTDADWHAWRDEELDAVCLLGGQVSGNLEIIDFDVGGELFAAWWDRIPVDLRNRLVIETTQSGGRHAIYRCETSICGCRKLAQRKDGDTVITLIETRGEGGLVLCVPTPGYEITQGDLSVLPVLAETERDVCCRPLGNSMNASPQFAVFQAMPNC